MSKPRYYLRIRVHEGEDRVWVYLERLDGCVVSAQLWGQMFPDRAEEVAAVLGLPVKRETQAATPDLEGVAPTEQKALFP